MGASSSKPTVNKSITYHKKRSSNASVKPINSLDVTLPEPDDTNRCEDTPGSCWAHSNARCPYDKTLQPCNSLVELETLKLIGKGSFGKVTLVRRRNGEGFYALKVLKKHHLIRASEVQHTLAERLILAKIRHPFIVRLESAFQDNSKLYLLLEYVNGGELFTHLRNTGHFNPSRVRQYACEITCALTYLHQNGIIYRDLKLENILLDSEGHIVLTDFGLCKIGSDGKTFCGTPEYLAPEVITDKKYTKAVDWWALGCITYELLTGLPPFYSEDVNEMYRKIVHSPLYIPPHVDEVCKDFLRKLLIKDPKDRLGSQSETAVRTHPYFKDINWYDVYNRRLVPEFVPVLSGPDDVSQIDQEFLNQFPESFNNNSYVNHVDNTIFQGFTYTNQYADGVVRMKIENDSPLV